MSRNRGQSQAIADPDPRARRTRDVRTPDLRLPGDGRQRVVVQRLAPEIDGGRFAIKRALGEIVAVDAELFADGHDALSAVLKFRHETEPEWTESPLQARINDRWHGAFQVERLGLYFYTVEAWVNPFRSWQRDLAKKFAAGLELGLELQTGRQLLEAAVGHAEKLAGKEPEREALKRALRELAPQSPLPLGDQVARATDSHLTEAMDTCAERSHPARYARELLVRVDPVLARFSSWYELFPRSCALEAGRHGTLKDCEALLPRIAAMGFDIVYLPPVHPVGRSYRKGRNNSLVVTPDDPGSPWAIGSEEGGHKSVHPDLGTLEHFRDLVRAARQLGLEVALDIAFQCSPDHPYVHEHPNWFRHRPDGSIQYAENPPKRYQDIYPLDFETDDWRALWQELKSIFEFWIEQGVRVFRVDNPHTKPFAFWEWCLGELKQANPELIFLAEAFTRPKVMYYLAKLGFTQSYNYFPWRNTKYELTTYLTELTQTEIREFFRPNLWPNTPDILTQYLQYGGRPAFITRLILAATLGASYGLYGPPFEAAENRPREPGSEEYLNSEKYEIRHWDFTARTPLADLMARLNRLRRETPALQRNDTLHFQEIDNEQIIAYSKHTPDLAHLILVVVNLDPHHTQSGWVRLDLERWGLSSTSTYQVHELLTDQRFLWSGARNYVELNPQFVPAHVFRLRRYIRTEQDFDYFL